MRILITTARMPYALDEIRKLGNAGHEIYAADTFKYAIGLGSKHIRKCYLTASPRWNTEQYIQDLVNIIQEKKIELLLPMSEEVLYISKHRDKLPEHVHLFAADFNALDVLHKKTSFVKFIQQLNLKMPASEIVSSRSELLTVIDQYGEYIARSAYSRANLELVSNVGASRSSYDLALCNPTPQHPWLVQEYIHGIDICSYSIVRQGKIMAHCTYKHPNVYACTGAGISFQSINEPETLHAASAIAKACNYHGQLSLDFRKNANGVYLIECNPRPTHGVCLMPAKMFNEAIFGTDEEIKLVDPGFKKQIYGAIIRSLIKYPKDFTQHVKALLSFMPDIIFNWSDPKPAFYQLLTYRLAQQYKEFCLLKNIDLSKSFDHILSAQFHDVSWNG